MSGPHLKAKRLGGKRPPGLPEPFAHYARSMESGPLSWTKEIVFQGRLIKPLLPFATSPLCTYTIDFLHLSVDGLWLKSRSLGTVVRGYKSRCPACFARPVGPGWQESCFHFA